tara:strand:- start:559 stop:771 length:213 start_codon:yes stop_codon:yes gene_type:complete
MWQKKYNNKQKGKTMTKKKIVDWSIVINYDEDNSWGVVDSTNNPVEIIHQNQLDDHILASVDSYLHEIKN